MAIRDKNFRYEVERWEGLIQFILFLASKGYTRIFVNYFPEKKKGRWEEIDEKIYRKYQANLTRGQIDYRRKQGYKVYKYFRWNQVMVLVSTEGEDSPEIQEEDIFLDLKTGQQKIQISERLHFILYYSGKEKKLKQKQKNGQQKKTINFTAKLGNETIDYWKQNLIYHIRMKHNAEVLQEVRKIDYVPSYSGIYEQKVQLRQFIFDEIRRHGVKFTEEEKDKISFQPRRYQINVFKKDKKIG